MNIFNLFASLKLDKSDYDKNIKEAQKEGEEFAESTEKKISPMAIAGWAAIGAAVLKVLQTVKNLAVESINYADKVSDLAAQYGVSTDAISEMQYIADQSSTSIEGLTSSMTMLYNRAKQDGEAFKNLGISVTDTEGNFKSMDELFWETAGALNDIENEGEKSAIMLDLFGRSAMSVGEVLRKSSDEIAQMRQEAHDLGVVMSKETVQAASDFNDTLASLKLQGKSIIAELLAGTPDAEEKFQAFMDRVVEVLEQYAPTFVRFFVRLSISIAIALQRMLPTLAVELIDTVIDVIFDTDWVKVGMDLGKALFEGIVNVVVSGLNAILGLFGVKIPKVKLFGSQDNSDYFTGVDLGEEYEITENVRQDITVKVEASGDTAISKESAEKTAEALAPYIDKILGGK